MLDTEKYAHPIESIRNDIDQLGAEDHSLWHGGTLCDRLTEAVGLRAQLDAEILLLTAEWDRRRAWEADGALSAASWMTHRLPISRRRAHEEVRTARFVDQHERVAKATVSGDITVDHVRAMARVVTDQKVDVFADHEDALVDAAEVLPIDDFTKVARRWSQLADDQLSADSFVTQYDNRRLTTATTFGGALHIDGLLDAEGGALFDAAIDKLSPPDPKDTPGGPRGAAQRRADALVQMARIALGGGEATGVSPTNLNVTVDAGTLAGSGGSLVESHCDIDWAGPVGRETMLRMGCDCSVSRVVMNGRSEVLDMGRRVRLATGVQRRALSVRDRGCVFPGCDRPDSWCDAHHLVHWANGGKTDLDNLCLMCRRHHVMVHEGGWSISKLPGGGFDARAPDE